MLAPETFAHETYIISRLCPRKELLTPQSSRLDFEVGGNPVGITRGGVAKRDPQPSFVVGGNPVGITRGGVGKRVAEPQLDFEVGGNPVGITRGGVSKREEHTEILPREPSVPVSYVPVRGSGLAIAEPL